MKEMNRKISEKINIKERSYDQMAAIARQPNLEMATEPHQAN